MNNPDFDFSHGNCWGHSIQRAWGEKGPLPDGRERAFVICRPMPTPGQIMRLADKSIWRVDKIERMGDGNPGDLYEAVLSKVQEVEEHAAS